MKTLRIFWRDLRLEERLLALYIVAFLSIELSAFLIGAKRILYPDLIFLLLLFVYIWKVAKKEISAQNIYTFAVKNRAIYGADGFDRSSISPFGTPGFSSGELHLKKPLIVMTALFMISFLNSGNALTIGMPLE